VLHRLNIFALLAGVVLLAHGTTNARGADTAAAPLDAPGSASAWTFSPADRILILSPHPDDETLCCGSLIRRAVQAGAWVGVVWVTSGDAFELDAVVVQHRIVPGRTTMRRLAQRRMDEAVAATTALGIDRAHLYFLGFPDRGIKRLITDYYYSAYTSRYTGAAAVPYEQAYQPGQPYRGENLEHAIDSILDATQPTLVLAPTPLDRHTDHSAVGDLAIRVMAHRRQDDRLRYWIVHGGREWPSPRRLRLDLPLLPPKLAGGLQWQQVTVSSAEQAAKLLALRQYHSQWEVMEPFLVAFVRSNELYSITPFPDETEAAPILDE
jgi:LmbE family N-acetylglucosaminyl deacetylase